MSGRQMPFLVGSVLPGNRICLVGGVGLAGTSVLVREMEGKLLGRFTQGYLLRCQMLYDQNAYEMGVEDDSTPVFVLGKTVGEVVGGEEAEGSGTADKRACFPVSAAILCGEGGFLTRRQRITSR